MKPNIEKKILREIEEINRDPKLGIYAYIEAPNVQSLKILMIGPEDSPYHGGFFLFKVDFPSDFPFSPPHVKFITPKYKSATCRLHPNLYGEGKVCLSILNTWSSNEWSPALTLEKIFITIQGLLDSNPIINEPGHSCAKTDPQAVAYIKVALYRTLTAAVVDMFNHPDLPRVFKTIIEKYFSENRQIYLEAVEKLAADDGQVIKCIHWTERIDYQKLKHDLTSISF